MNNGNPCKRWSTPKTLPQKYPDVAGSEAAVRYWIFNAKTNGFDKCIRRIGRKILIDLDLFEKWIDSKVSE